MREHIVLRKMCQRESTVVHVADLVMTTTPMASPMRAVLSEQAGGEHVAILRTFRRAVFRPPPRDARPTAPRPGAPEMADETPER